MEEGKKEKESKGLQDEYVGREWRPEGFYGSHEIF